VLDSLYPQQEEKHLFRRRRKHDAWCTVCRILWA